MSVQLEKIPFSLGNIEIRLELAWTHSVDSRNSRNLAPLEFGGYLAR